MLFIWFISAARFVVSYLFLSTRFFALKRNGRLCASKTFINTAVAQTKGWHFGTRIVAAYYQLNC